MRKNEVPTGGKCIKGLGFFYRFLLKNMRNKGYFDISVKILSHFSLHDSI